MTEVGGGGKKLREKNTPGRGELSRKAKKGGGTCFPKGEMTRPTSRRRSQLGSPRTGY